MYRQIKHPPFGVLDAYDLQAANDAMYVLLVSTSTFSDGTGPWELPPGVGINLTCWQGHPDTSPPAF